MTMACFTRCEIDPFRRERFILREAWRNLEAHRAAQAAGRKTMFKEYRLRIAEIVRDYGLTERAEAPADSRAAHG